MCLHVQAQAHVAAHRHGEPDRDHGLGSLAEQVDDTKASDCCWYEAADDGSRGDTPELLYHVAVNVVQETSTRVAWLAAVGVVHEASI